MKTCKTCKWWKEHGYSFGDCFCEKFEYQGSPTGSKDRLLYSDSECYSAHFETGKDFGCVHWEEKEMKMSEINTDNDVQMRMALEEIREIYAGMDGFIAETCPEGYQQRIIKQMYDTAINGLEGGIDAKN